MDINYNLVLTALALNRLDEAQVVFKEGQAWKSVSVAQVLNQYWLAFLRNDPAGMQKESARGMGLDGLAFLSEQAGTEAYHGRFRRARELARRAMALGKGTGDNASVAVAARPTLHPLCAEGVRRLGPRDRGRRPLARLPPDHALEAGGAILRSSSAACFPIIVGFD